MARKRNRPKNGSNHGALSSKEIFPDSSIFLNGNEGRNTESQANVGKVEVTNGTLAGSASESCIRGQKNHNHTSKSSKKSINDFNIIENIEPLLSNGFSLEAGTEVNSVLGLSGVSIQENSAKHGAVYLDCVLRCHPHRTSAASTALKLFLSLMVVVSNFMHVFFSTLKAGCSWLDVMVTLNLMNRIFLVQQKASYWSKRPKLVFIELCRKTVKFLLYVQKRYELLYPVAVRWMLVCRNLLILLLLLWLEVTLTGIKSLLYMETVSFFSVIWCSVFSALAIVGVSKFVIGLVFLALVGIYVGPTFAVMLVGISGAVILWINSSWLTILVLLFGGSSFMLNHESLAISVVTLYSVYSTWTCGGWVVLIIALNCSFISSNVLLYCLKNKIHEHGRHGSPPEQQSAGVQDDRGFSSHPPPASTTVFGSGVEKSSRVPSMSGVFFEDEVAQILNSTDHYTALGLSRFENFDASSLKREYKKKAMLVHPDKNMGNERAAEAFKKLQNAYEVLLDSLKRKAYDDELKRAELMNSFYLFQRSCSSKVNCHASGFHNSSNCDKNIYVETRRVACDKCDHFHIWFHTEKLKSKARWCQECQDLHQAKDGDGWVEQTSQPFLFGLLEKVNAPFAYVCAEGRIYEATDWYTCQGISSAANTHKPGFHLNVSAWVSSYKESSSRERGGTARANFRGRMSEQQFSEWLQNAMQAGLFEPSASATSSHSPREGEKSSANQNGTPRSQVNRKKKGKRPR